MKSKPTYQELEKEIENLRKENNVASSTLGMKLLDYINDGIYIRSPDYIIEYINEPMKKIIGGDKTGQKCYKAIYNKTKVCEWCVYNKLKKGETITQELIHPLTNNTYSVKNILLDNGSKLTSYYNINELLTKNYKLRASQIENQILSQAVNQTTASIVITNIKGQIEFTNPKFTEITGYTAEEAKNINPKVLKSGHTTNEEYKELWETITSGKTWKGEFLNVKKNKETYWERAIITPIIDENNNITNYLAVKEDITKQKAAEEALKESEEDFRLLFENSPLGTYIARPDGTIIIVNQTALNILGSPSKESTRQINVLTFPPLVKNGYASKFSECINTGEIITMEMLYKSKWGKEIFISSYIIPLKNNDGKVVSVYTVMEDITKQKEAEQALKDSEEKYRILSDDAIMSIVIHDINGNIKYLNKAALKTMKADNAKKMINTPVTNFVHHDYIEEAINTIKKLFTGEEEVFHKEQKFIRFDGEYINVDVFGKLIDYNNEKVIQITFKDITSRVKAEKALKNSEERLNKLINSVPDIICFKDGEGRWLIANDADLKLFKLEGVDYVGKKDSELAAFSPFYHDAFMGCEDTDEIAWLNKNISRDIEVIPNPEGDDSIYDIIKIPIFNPDNTRNSLAVFGRDITKIKETEDALKESNDTKDKFFSIIAHDLKSPFNAILGFSKILLEDHKKIDAEKREKLIITVNNSAKRAFELLENLLTWSRSQLGRIKYSPEKLFLKIRLFETMLYVQEQASKKNIIILDDVLEDVLIYADKNMLAVVLRNLISNAIKFTGNGGSILISSKEQKNSNFIEISVKDTGVGIPKESIDELFQIDKNISTIGTENETGTGLGLILCKEFVEIHGGKIWVESTEGEGSTFIFTIPKQIDKEKK